MTQFSIHIPDELKSVVDSAVASGDFSDASSFIASLLYTAKAEQEAEPSFEESLKLEVLRREIQRGLDDIANGDVAEFDVEDIIARGKVRLAVQAAAHG